MDDGPSSCGFGPSSTFGNLTSSAPETPITVSRWGEGPTPTLGTVKTSPIPHASPPVSETSTAAKSTVLRFGDLGSGSGETSPTPPSPPMPTPPILTLGTSIISPNTPSDEETPGKVDKSGKVVDVAEVTTAPRQLSRCGDLGSGGGDFAPSFSDFTPKIGVFASKNGNFASKFAEFVPKTGDFGRGGGRRSLDDTIRPGEEPGQGVRAQDLGFRA